MSNAMQIQNRFRQAVQLLESVPDGQNFRREILDGMASHSIGKKDGDYFWTYVFPGFNYPGRRDVVFWFCPQAGKKHDDGSKSEMKVDFEIGVKIIESAIDCDDLINLFKAYLGVEAEV